MKITKKKPSRAKSLDLPLAVVVSPSTRQNNQDKEAFFFLKVGSLELTRNPLVTRLIRSIDACNRRHRCWSSLLSVDGSMGPADMGKIQLFLNHSTINPHFFSVTGPKIASSAPALYINYITSCLFNQCILIFIGRQEEAFHWSNYRMLSNRRSMVTLVQVSQKRSCLLDLQPMRQMQSLI